MMTETDQYDDIRQHVEKRLKRRRDIYIAIAAYVVTNVALWFFFRESWVLWVTLGGGIGITAVLYDYYNKYGPGAQHKEDEIQREIQREMTRRAVYEKPKNDSHMRLTDDGELEEVPEDEVSVLEKHKRNS